MVSLIVLTSCSNAVTRASRASIVALIVATSLSIRVLMVETSVAIASRSCPFKVLMAVLIASLYASVISAAVLLSSLLNCAIEAVFSEIACALLPIAVALAEIRAAFLAISSAFLAIVRVLVSTFDCKEVIALLLLLIRVSFASMRDLFSSIF